ncbi:hypothetical protein NB688_003738 [Xanthomonas sacchari]|uniref:Uncharacterized protein n=2 Tax=Xanthomonas sacchari TaxID=56458 RepID=A0ABT3E1K1_9XANT|nr:hypothetical protein [Xanthomonas sacchari]MCW0401651.1 hypothetical protein [Xanthomonas sacchari]MCW0421572.1 hypothetical protein [Xanthomonas sacchari]UYK72331.1 hypothetical protein NG828_19395 [Xanthomonas sacchari]
MGKRKRRPPPPMPTLTRLQRLIARLERPVLMLMAAVMVAVAAMKLYLLAKALQSGVYIGVPRAGPKRIYQLATDPGHYWFSIAWDSVVCLVLLALAIATGWALMALRKPK